MHSTNETQGENSILHARTLMKNSSGKFKELLTSSHPLKCRSSEICMEVPAFLGRGLIREVKLRYGMKLTILNYKTYKPSVSMVEAEYSAFGFRFSLSGRTQMGMKCLKNDFVITEGQSGVYYFPDMTCVSETAPEEHVCRVLIQINPQRFRELMDEEALPMPAELCPPVNNGAGDPFNAVEAITPPMQTVLEQIIHCPYQGTVRQLFLEGKTLELLSYKLARLSPDKSGHGGCSSLKPDHMDRVHAAGAILTKNLRHPPGLTELSRLVGLSRNKLLSSFNKVYGTTPAGYIRDRRLEKARSLLENGKMNVTETAYSVGYSSLSHFASVFKKYYGTPPSHYH